jgi:hypothetical protein
MKYSKWKPSVGGYDVFEERGGQSVDLGNDLPVPNLTGGSPIGVSSVEAGRRATGRLVKVGTSPMPQGMILATRSGQLGFLPEIPGGTSGLWMLLAGLGFGWLLWRK